MFSLLLALATPAQALPVPCHFGILANPFPADGAVDVPVDIQPAALMGNPQLGGGDCLNGTAGVEWIGLYEIVDGEALPLFEGELERAGAQLYLPIPLDLELAPNTEHLIVLEPPEDFSAGMSEEDLALWVREGRFTTGEARAAELVGEPEIERARVYDHRPINPFAPTTRELELDVLPVEDPQGVSLVLVQDADVPGRTYDVLGADELESHVNVPTPDHAREDLCVELVQLDGRGEEIGRSEAVCRGASLGGCSATGAVGSVGLALLGLLGALRRRR
ncbi:MAG: hypothetical protein H6741_29065 [Alphaproteobacteria bacterium]|nr:hypothetical protein [Alphaproteobacteria bacterium]MCB9796770.1 hypothetical protein [Alphaproteobacteria bacterium]